MVTPRLSLQEQLREAVATIERLQTENDALRAENESLADRVTALESELRADSTTTSKPPSQDRIEPRQKRAERRAAARAKQAQGKKRAQGKQPGAPGAHLKRREPDKTVPHDPECCSDCGRDLKDAEVTGEVRSQVIDLPPVRPEVTDHIAYRRRCVCGTETLGTLPPEARAPVCWGPEVRVIALYMLVRQHLPIERTAELLEDLLGAPVSTGWLCQIQQEAAVLLVPFLVDLKGRLRKEPVVHADETGTRVRTTKHWMHTLATGMLTLVAVHRRRGVKAFEAIGVIPGYKGTIVHDGWAPYEVYDEATHAQCGAHVLRHLDGVGVDETFALWTNQMTGILMDAKAASEAAAGAGEAAVSEEIAAKIRTRYNDTLDVAFALLPSGPPPPRRHRGGWSSLERKAWNLATRMRGDADQVLRLLDDTRVPFTNNIAEQALRMVKLHDKISGCFYSVEGAEAFAATRSYLQTADKHGENLIGVIRQLFSSGPWLPPYPAGGT